MITVLRISQYYNITQLLFTGFASPKRPTQNPEPDPLPTFGSQGRRFRVVTNDTVVLPCDVINPGEYHMRCLRLNIKTYLIIKIYFSVLSIYIFSFQTITVK